MRDTSYILPASKFDRMVGRWNRGRTAATDTESHAINRRLRRPSTAAVDSTPRLADYVRFMQMILRKGRGVNNAVILQPKTVESMEVNQIGKATAGKMRSYRPNSSSDVDIQPGATEKWGLGFLINTTAYTGGRAAGSLGVGRAIQHLLLDRSEERHLRRAADAVPAVRGQGGRRTAERFRAGGLRQPGIARSGRLQFHSKTCPVHHLLPRHRRVAQNRGKCRSRSNRDIRRQFRSVHYGVIKRRDMRLRLIRLLLLADHQWLARARQRIQGRRAHQVHSALRAIDVNVLVAVRHPARVKDILCE